MIAVTDIMSTRGKTAPMSIPFLRSSLFNCAKMPTRPGPAAPPRSPAIARNANIAVPPLGSLFERMLMVPGHMIPTEKPHRIQPVRQITGDPERDAAK